MKTKALFLCLLLSSAPGWADQIKFNDGRVCNPCSVVRTPQGFISAVYDKAGNNWLTPGAVVLETSTHPFAMGAWKWITKPGSMPSANTVYGNPVPYYSGQTYSMPPVSLPTPTPIPMIPFN